MFAPLVFAATLGAATAPVVAADGRVTMTLHAEAAQVAPGDSIRVGVRFELPDGWHMYWKNPGDAGMATSITFRAEGATFEPLRWPTPERFESSGIVTYGYREEVLLWTTARIGGATTLVAEVDVLVCEVDCIPASEVLRLPITSAPVSDKAPGLFDAWAGKEPRSLAALGFTAQVGELAPVRPGDSFSVDVDLACGDCAVRGAGDGSAVFAERVPAVSLRPTGWEKTPGGVRVRLAGKAGPDAQPGDQLVPITIGLIEAPGVVVEVPIPRRAPAVAAATPAAASPLPLLTLLALAFLGGLILNLMPCVLPVLAIKVVGFTRLAQSGRRSLLSHGLAYAAGAVAAMLALAALVIGLSAAGQQVGWGFQFQEPRFAVGVGAVLVAMALAALGVWRVGGLGATAAMHAVSGQEAGALRRSVGEGVLAVILATPCSAPLLGSAIGAALASPPLTIVLAFAAVGLGLAAPLVAVALVPGVARLLPRPGAWMETLEHALGFALLAAVVWLAWLVGRVAGAGGSAAALGLWLGVAFLVWLVGRAQRAEKRPLVGALGAIAVLATLALAPWFSPEAEEPRATTSAGLTWQPWQEDAVAAELAAGRAVFVDFTADWCITCKANEHAVIDTDEVRAAISRHDVAVFRADWTRKDERIRAALARHGKAGVPMYLVYSPARPEAPEVLPELLTPGRLIEAFASARPVSQNEPQRRIP